MVQGILLGLGALAGTSLLEPLASPTEPSFCEARPPYTVLRKAPRPSLLFIFFIILIVLRYGANFISMEGTSSVNLHGA